MTLLDAARQALEEWHTEPGSVRMASLMIALRQAIGQAEQEPVATKQMLRWVEHLKRLSDDGQHMSIPGLSSGACWELAIELEQFIKNTNPPQRKPLTDEEIDRVTDQQWASNNHKPIYAAHRAYARSIERAHGIGGGE